jgi:integrase
MGRTRTKNHGLPPRLYARRNKRGDVRYFYMASSGARNRLWLGSDLAEAKRKWAELERGEHRGAVLFADVAARYEAKEIPKKAPRTQKDNLAELANLLKVFGQSPLDSIRPKDVLSYIDMRSEKAAVRANREIALLSHIWNKARGWGFTDLANPCAGIERNKEEGRDRYVTEAEFLALWQSATEPWMQDDLDLALLTGQRVSDVLKMKRTDIQDGHLLVSQGKTKAKQRIRIMGELATVIERALGRPRSAIGLGLIQDDRGQTPTYWRAAKAFQATRSAAGLGKDLQFRDLRAKAATDKESSEELGAAQKLLGHASQSMTEKYVRRHVGTVVEPLKRK